ncbi:hypothetical protein AMATHDRAFT_119022, partial [Amanita thiersii Skay4041]
PLKGSLSDEAIPKSAARVLNATKIRHRVQQSHGTNSLEIRPGEPIQHFNRRVEDDMRPLVKSAIQASKAIIRQTLKETKRAAQAKRLKLTSPSTSSPPLQKKHKPNQSPSGSGPRPSAQIREFEKLSTSLPRRLNDVAQAPPLLTTLPRGVKKVQQADGASKHDGILSMAQRAMMEEEREKAIKKYRMLKANR